MSVQQPDHRVRRFRRLLSAANGCMRRAFLLHTVAAQPEASDLGRVADLFRAAERVVTRVGDASVLVVRSSRGVFAVANRCPHMGVPLDDASVAGRQLTCAHHGRTFDLVSGSCRAPARARSLVTYRAWVAGGHVWVAVEPTTTQVASVPGGRTFGS